MKFNDLSARPRLGHLALFGLLAAGAGQARAATFTVTTNADSGTGSLRAAIVSANATTGADVIAFNLPSNARVITPLSPLPSLTRPTTIDATTQPGYSNAPAVALDGSKAGSGANGLVLSYNSNIVRGLDIVNWGGSGVLVTGSGVSGCRVEANFIGLDGQAAAALPNSYGVFLTAGTQGNTIGGTSSALWNYIGGNSQIGIVLQGSSNNSILGNIIGTDGQAQTAIPNAIGILLQSGSANNTIGGSTDSIRNIISGSAIAGIEMNDAGTTGNKILGNVIGMGAGGTSAIPNRAGIIIANGATSNIVGAGSGAENLISGNTDEGVWIFNAGTMNNKVTENLIGVDSSGKTAAGSSFGVKIESGAQANTVGPGNIISGNTAGVFITGNSTNSNNVSGNNIGLDGPGTTAIPNGVGVTIAGGAQNNIIGGLTGALANYISGNLISGIALLDANTNGNVIEGNIVGADGAGANAIPNKYGINIVNGPCNNQIGGNTLAAGNVVSGNSSVGIVVQGNTSIGNIFQGNVIGSNGGSGVGTKALPNGTGIRIDQSARDTVIGGINAGEGNLISGNRGAGIDVRNTATGTIIQGNNIGTQAGGSGSLPNGTGVLLESGAQFTKIGAGKDDTDRNAIAGQGNIIANNQTNVAVTGSTTFDNSIRGNQITSTSVLPIDLNNDGVTANDSKDGDSGGNRLQNSPVITGVTTDTDGAHVSGTLNSTPSTSFVIDFYHNPDPATVGGAEYRGNVQVTTDANGNASFTFTDTGTLNNQIFRATATSLATGDTSEYSGVLVSNPTVSIATPATGSRLNSLSAFSGKAFDPDGIASIFTAIIRYSDGAHWNGSAWVQDDTAHVASTYTASSKSWAVTGTLPVASASGASNTFTPGDYDFIALAFDSTGAQTRTDSVVTFEYRTDYVFTGLAATCPYGDSNACATFVPGDPRNWSDSRNWSPNGVPGANDTATITGFDVALNTTDNHKGSVTVAGLTLKNGNLHGASLAFSTAAGSVNTFNYNGGLLDVLTTTINASGKLFISPETSPAEIGNGCTINNSGAAVWNGPAAIQADGNVIFNNLTGSTFYLAGDGTPFTDANPNDVFNLSAGSSFGKHSAFPSSGSSDIIGWNFNFSGTVLSDTGVLRFADGNTVNFKDKSQTSGSGIVRLEAGAFTLAGTVTNNGHLEETGGTLNGTGLLVNASGANFHWTGGTVFKLTNNSGGTFALDGDQVKEFANGAIVNNSGSMSVAGTGTVQGDGNVVLTNLSGGTLQLLTDAAFTTANPNNKLVNALNGTVTKAAGDLAQSSQIYWEYDNSGLTEVSTGTLALNGGGTINSTLQSDPNGVLNFTSGDFTLANGAIFVGDGKSEVTGASLNLTGAITSGTSVKARIFDMVAGSLTTSGTGTFTAYGNLNWTGGTIGGKWIVPPTAQVILSGLNVKEIANGTTITNNGGVFIQGSPGLLQGDGNVTFNNQNNGIFTLRGDGSFFTSANPNNVFNNAAGCILQKETGSGTGLLNTWTLNNAGFVTCGAGTLEIADGDPVNFNDGGVINGASKVLLSGGFINTTGNTNINANMVMTGGALVGTGQLTLTTKGGFDWQGGSILHLNINAGALATLTGANVKELSNGGVINNSGTVNLAGSGTFQGDGNVVFNNLSGAIFNSNSDTQFTNANPNNKFVNGVGATFNKQKGSTSASVNVGWSYSNNGTTSVTQGVFESSGGGVGKGVFAPAASTTVRFSGGDYTLNTGAALKGKGTIEVSGAIVTAAAPVACGSTDKVNTLLVDGGELTSSASGSVTAFGTVNWTGGMIGGNFNVVSTGILNMTGVNVKELANGAVFTTAGTASFNGTGTLQADGNVVFNNSAGGTFKVLKGSDFTNANPNNVFNNGGTFIMGNPVAPINMGWDFTNTAKGTLSVDVNGKSSTQFDQLKVGGTANLNGTLAIVKGASYTPALNDAVKVITASTINGTFPTVTGLSIDTSHKWSVLYNPNDVTLKVVNKTYSLSVRTFKWVNSNGTLVKSFLSGVSVTVLQGSATVASAQTGTDGFATFNLVAGTYTVKATEGGITFDPASQSVTLPTSGIDGVSPNGAIAFKTYILTAKVVDGSGQDVTGVTVNLSGPATASVPTASNGVALFDNLGAGTYTLTPVPQAGFTFDKASATVSLPTSGLTNLSPNGNVKFVRTANAPAKKAEPTPTPTPEATPQPTATPEPESVTSDEGSGKSF